MLRSIHICVTESDDGFSAVLILLLNSHLGCISQAEVSAFEAYDIISVFVHVVITAQFKILGLCIFKFTLRTFHQEKWGARGHLFSMPQGLFLPEAPVLPSERTVWFPLRLKLVKASPKEVTSILAGLYTTADIQSGYCRASVISCLPIKNHLSSSVPVQRPSTQLRPAAGIIGPDSVSL